MMQQCRTALGWNADKNSGSSETGNLEHVGIRNLLGFPVNFNSFEKKIHFSDYHKKGLKRQNLLKTQFVLPSKENMDVNVHMYVCVCVCACMCTCMYVYMCLCICVCMFVLVFVNVCIHMCVHILVCNLYVCVCVCNFMAEGTSMKAILFPSSCLISVEATIYGDRYL